MEERTTADAPVIDPRVFRQTVGQFVTGVTVIAARIDGEIRAMTANSFTGLSLDPPLVLFCVARKARLADGLDRATGFCANILRLNQQDLSSYFAGAWKQPAPPSFSFVDWSGWPRLEGSASSVGCRIERLVEAGDHWIVIGRVIAVHHVPCASPLAFFNGHYAMIGAQFQEEILISGF